MGDSMQNLINDFVRLFKQDSALHVKLAAAAHCAKCIGIRISHLHKMWGKDEEKGKREKQFGEPTKTKI